MSRPPIIAQLLADTEVARGLRDGVCDNPTNSLCFWGQRVPADGWPKAETHRISHAISKSQLAQRLQIERSHDSAVQLASAAFPQRPFWV